MNENIKKNILVVRHYYCNYYENAQKNILVNRQYYCNYVLKKCIYEHMCL